jgi:3-oxoacyl-[acyl-carrier-protein] synthase-3
MTVRTFPTTVVGSGTAYPGRPIPTAEVAARLRLDLGWLDHFVGIDARHLAVDPDTGAQTATLTTLGCTAAVEALAEADLRADDVDFLVLATATPDELMPSTANRIADGLGLVGVPTYQVQSGCAGAVAAIEVAGALLATGHRTGIVIAGDVCARHYVPEVRGRDVDPAQLVNHVLFGDGVGALVVTADDRAGLRVRDTRHAVLAAGREPGQIVRWFGAADVDAGPRESPFAEDYKAIEGLVPRMAEDVLDELLDRRGWSRDDVDHLLPPQLSGRMTDAIVRRLGVPAERAVNCVRSTGNCGNALPFIQLDRVRRIARVGARIAVVCVESSMWIAGGIALECVA